MNRIVLIGNGFDLAHGLDTSYGSFIDWLWMSFGEEIAGLNKEKTFHDNSFIQISNLPSFKLKFEDCSNHKEFIEEIRINKSEIISTNIFLTIISSGSHLKWVDIELVYYTILVSIVEGNTKNVFGYDLRKYSIEDLNSDFASIREKLIEYLDTKIRKKPTVKEAILRHLESIFQYNEFPKAIMGAKVEEELEKFNKLSSEIDQNTARLNEIEELLIEKVSSIDPKRAIEFQLKNPHFKLIDSLELRPKDILLLNFNYTSTHAKYIPRLKEEEIEATVNHIHGDLKNIEENPIIFGFGDELDEKYKEIENINDNRYLENIKSIEYLQTDSYKKLLNYIESDKYQIFIMGHSCGLSDRTLLNTLFEHENCISIKPFYYKKSDGTDNYKEITQNISRNFKDKRKMREIVVNKKFCKPLT